jgi:hypothetical protein
MKSFFAALLISASSLTLYAGQMDDVPNKIHSLRIPRVPFKWEAATWSIGGTAQESIDEIARIKTPDLKLCHRTIAEKSTETVRLQHIFPDGSSTAQWVVNGFELSITSSGQPITLAAAGSESAVASGAVDLADLEWVKASHPVGQATVRGILCTVFEEKAGAPGSPSPESMVHLAEPKIQPAPTRRLAFIDQTTGFPVRVLDGSELSDYHFETLTEKLVLPPEAAEFLSTYLRKLDRTFPRIPSQNVR